ncbi:MAG: membrane dipeptidase [Clostridia bacterium]|nr:membrane dipeptidase [Clostridia bacterium]
MKVFDLHCDTAGECYNEKISLFSNDLHLSIERAAKYDEYTQLFAVWIPDKLRGDDAVEYFNNVADNFYKELEAHKEYVSVYGSGSETPVKALLTVEGGSACGGTIEGLKALYKRGVRVITLTWNAQNEIASGAFAEGGLSDFGKEFVRTAEELGVVLDVSHLNRQSFFEFAEFARKPFIASHSNADIVNNDYGRKRNLTKEQIDVIKNAKGLVGLNYYTEFIEDDEARGIDALCRQIDYFCEQGYEDIIALGSDYDGCRINPVLHGVEKLEGVYKELLSRGYSNDLLEKIFWKNAESFFNKMI